MISYGQMKRTCQCMNFVCLHRTSHDADTLHIQGFATKPYLITMLIILLSACMYMQVNKPHAIFLYHSKGVNESLRLIGIYRTELLYHGPTLLCCWHSHVIVPLGQSPS
jgi:hypothetical protein